MAEVLSSRKRKHQEEQITWPELSLEILERIYRFLSRKDQTNMSLVCKNWSEGFELPSLWKSFKVSTGDLYCGGPVMEFTHRYSQWFKHVEIKCIFPFVELKDSSWRDRLKTLLQILIETPILYSLKFKLCFPEDDTSDDDEEEEEEVYIVEHNSITNENLYELIGNLLGKQRHLKRLEFHRCSLKYTDGVELLNKAIENGGDSLGHFVLRDFIDCASIYEELKLVNPFQLPSSSQFLKIDYPLVFGISDANLSHANKILRNCNGELTLKIYAEVGLFNFEGFQILPSSDWINLKERFPKLGVELYVSSVEASKHHPALFIVEDMPITRLGYKFLGPFFPVECGAFLEHLCTCRVNDHLESFSLKWPADITDIDAIFIPFLNACRKLKVLDLDTEYPSNVDGLTRLLTQMINNRPESLEKFSLRLDYHGRKVLDILSTTFKPLFKSVKVDFKPILYSSKI